MFRDSLSNIIFLVLKSNCLNSFLAISAPLNSCFVKLPEPPVKISFALGYFFANRINVKSLSAAALSSTCFHIDDNSAFSAPLSTIMPSIFSGKVGLD